MSTMVKGLVVHSPKKKTAKKTKTTKKQNVIGNLESDQKKQNKHETNSVGSNNNKNTHNNINNSNTIDNNNSNSNKNKNNNNLILTHNTNTKINNNRMIITNNNEHHITTENETTPAKSTNTDVTDLSSVTDPFVYSSKNQMRADEIMKNQLTLFVRKDLFPMWKFFTHPKQLEYTENQNTVCQWICNTLNIPKNQKQDWWREKKGLIVSMLNRKRSDVAGSMKNTFIGKSTMSYIYKCFY